ncbi:MAG TPA: ABC transporter permease subunit, partial [Pirellulales bacterium]
VLAHSLIVAGGIGTIVAVSMVCVFLVWSVLPLFAGGAIDELPPAAAPWKTPPLRTAVAENGVAGWALLPDGSLDFFRLDSGHAGKSVWRHKLTDDAELTSVSTLDSDDRLAVGFADGSVRLGNIALQTSFVQPTALPPELRRLDVGQTELQERSLLERAAEHRFRRYELTSELDAPIKIATAGIRLLDVAKRGHTTVIASFADDGRLRLTTLKAASGLKRRRAGVQQRDIELPLPALAPTDRPVALYLSGIANNLLVIWKDGALVRYDLQKLGKPQFAELNNVLSQAGATVTATDMLVGKETLVVGDSTGRIQAWFRVHKPNASGDDTFPGDRGGWPSQAVTPTGDGPGGPSSGDVGPAAGASGEESSGLVAAHLLAGPDAAVTSLATSSRLRTLAAAYANGDVRLFYVTNDSLLLESRGDHHQPARSLAIFPRDDGILAIGAERMRTFRLDVPHPEVSLWSLFMPVWYEGYDAPSHEWQSSGGNDSFEPKLGLTKLIFGTFKATFYSLLIAMPLALLAAVYTSEFLHKRVRVRIKPTIELMASLPSVVLGFLGALVLAPLIERGLTTILTGMACVPMTLLLAAFVWQLLPKSARTRLSHWRFVAICLTLPLGCWLAVLIAPLVERLFFAGDMMLWLAGHTGTGTGGWLLLLLPLAGLFTAWALASYVNPILRSRAANWSEGYTAAIELLKFISATAAAFGVALSLSWTLTSAGFDPRGTFEGTYEQLNALVVGLMMGFAIIPIIYTIAEDALSTVPEHLRSASLGAGATPWQTAVRIIIPTAMSGLFSAVMIGLGRAVGETMIVLMAAGNTPVLDWNIFNGFRTLSGNIAEELPEAVKDSTHYRTLFLAALVLFAITFLLNTVAERVRQRFRKRAFQL